MIPLQRSEKFEREPSSEFLQVLGLARNRLFEAYATHTYQYPHIQNGDNPATLKPIATYVLAESYKLMAQGKSELISISVPTVDYSYISPRFAEGPEAEYFLVGKPDDFASFVAVNETNYDDLFTNADQPLIEELAQKLLTYEIVPLLKQMQDLDEL